MKRSLRRREIQPALAPALVKAIESLTMEQSSLTLLRTIRALTHLAFDLAQAGEAPPAIMMEQLRRVARRRLPDLAPSQPVLLMKEAKA